MKLDRLKEASTWRGIFLLAGIFGIQINPELQMEIIKGIGVVYALINVFRKEKA